MRLIAFATNSENQFKTKQWGDPWVNNYNLLLMVKSRKYNLYKRWEMKRLKVSAYFQVGNQLKKD